jgi:hypothetical protein
MKFTCFPIGHFGLILTFSVLTTACNQEEFFKAEEFLVGNDAYCFREGPDANACRALVDKCRVAYLEAEDESLEPEFLMCIGNPNYDPDGSSTGGSTSGDGSSDGSTTGGTSGGYDGPNVEVPPSIKDTVAAKCENLDPKYIWEKVEKDKKGKKTITKKVKICHHSARGEHNIVIACPALKAHVKHHDDYIGVCAE